MQSTTVLAPHPHLPIMSEGHSRREFFRRLLHREARVHRPFEPASAGPPPAPSAYGLQVPDDQHDIADALVGLGRLHRAEDGTLTESREMAGYLAAAQLGSAAAVWIDRVRSASPLDPAREPDAHTLATLRSQIARRGEGSG
jgi:hypothetical protein